MSCITYVLILLILPSFTNHSNNDNNYRKLKQSETDNGNNDYNHMCICILMSTASILFREKQIALLLNVWSCFHIACIIFYAQYNRVFDSILL